MKKFIITISILLAVIAYYWVDRFDPDVVKGKRVLITGASTGIGEQIAYNYARLGAEVFITARREKRLQEVVEQCRLVGRKDGKYHYKTADMAVPESVESLFQEAIQVMGGLDTIVLNHIMLIDLGDWTGSKENLTLIDNLMNVNFHSYVRLASLSLPHLETSSGSIVVLNSLAGRVSQPYLIAYSSTKFALDGFFSGLRQEFIIRDSKVSITACTIGLIGTDNCREQLNKFGMKKLLQLAPIATPEDTAMAVIKAATLRQKELFYPYAQAKFGTMFRDIFPESLAAFNRYVYESTKQS